jgi:hypothetical protein
VRRFFKSAAVRTLASERERSRLLIVLFAAASCSLLFFGSVRPQAASGQDTQGPYRGQSQEEAMAKSMGCISCHTATDEATMHPSKGVHLGCTDCHGGNNSVAVAAGTSPASPEYQGAKEKAHVQPRDSYFKNRTTLPEGAYTKWLKESPEFVKFINPGDLRVARETCGTAGCHPNETRAVSTNMMTHSG